MDVIVVPLDSSTDQLHDSLGSRRTCECSAAGFSSQNGDCAWGVYQWKAAFCCAFFGGEKDSMQRIFIKKCCLFMMGSVCHVKRFTTGSRNSLKDARKSQMMPDQVQKWLREQSKGFYAVGFRHNGKAMGQVSRCWWRCCWEIHVYSRFEHHMFYVLHPFVTYLLTLPHNNTVVDVQPWEARVPPAPKMMYDNRLENMPLLLGQNFFLECK
jgi:hypothetical protein